MESIQGRAVVVDVGGHPVHGVATELRAEDARADRKVDYGDSWFVRYDLDAGMSLDRPFGAFIGVASGLHVSVEPQELPAVMVSQVQTNRPAQ